MVTAASELPQDEGTPLMRVALACLLVHCALMAFSGLAFATFLSPPFPEWLQTPQNQRIMAFGFKWGGQTTVVFGALAGLLHSVGRLGLRTAIIVFIASFGISLGSELLGTSTGLPFGPYSYTNQLGYKILGLVPFNIPTSWFFMLYASLAICGRLLPAKDDGVSRWYWSFIAGLVLTAWDVSMDPAMVVSRHWLWYLPPLEGMPLWQNILIGGHFYGMPLTNWLGWLLTGIVVARVMLMIVPPSRWARDVSPSNFPLGLYAVNAVLPLGICAGRGLWGAFVLGALAMALPLYLAMRKRPQVAGSATRPTGNLGDIAVAGR
ncbi:MAG TPA: carotenoid biosynthesis protein [Gemmatimonadaceae bacterium]|nr:carotenoid biosynthesis protein [Gemmatimonadaceae bacterium]